MSLWIDHSFLPCSSFGRLPQTTFLVSSLLVLKTPFLFSSLEWKASVQHVPPLGQYSRHLSCRTLLHCPFPAALLPDMKVKDKDIRAGIWGRGLCCCEAGFLARTCLLQ